MLESVYLGTSQDPGELSSFRSRSRFFECKYHPNSANFQVLDGASQTLGRVMKTPEEAAQLKVRDCFNGIEACVDLGLSGHGWDSD